MQLSSCAMGLGGRLRVQALARGSLHRVCSGGTRLLSSGVNMR